MKILILLKVLSSVDDTVCETCPQGSIPNQVILTVIILKADEDFPHFPSLVLYIIFTFYFNQGKSECQALPEEYLTLSSMGTIFALR